MHIHTNYKKNEKKKVTSTLLICKTTSVNLHFGVKMSLTFGNRGIYMHDNN